MLPYARVHRSGHPASQPYYSVLHEGLIGVSGEHGLQEITYADAIKSGVPKTIENVIGGWLGITDKYWATALVPDQKAAYRAMYSALKANDRQTKTRFKRTICSAPSSFRRAPAKASKRISMPAPSSRR